MKLIKFLLIGIWMGVIFSKSEIISWYRIYEMFKFKSFHMYGVIGSSVVLGIIFIQLIKRFKLKSFQGEKIVIADKDKTWKRYILGGTIFGLGWALTGACPGPMYTLLGSGFVSFLIVIFSATIGTFVYGLLKDKLPH